MLVHTIFMDQHAKMDFMDFYGPIWTNKNMDFVEALVMQLPKVQNCNLNSQLLETASQESFIN